VSVIAKSAPERARVEAQFQSALDAHRAGEVGRAAALYEAVLEAAPAHSGALYYSGMLALAAGDAALAAERLRAVVEAGESDAPQVRYNLGVALQATGELAEALEQFERVPVGAALRAEAQHNIGRVRFARGEMRAARNALQAAVALRPDLAEAWNSLGQLEEREGRLGEALAAFERAHELAPELVAASRNRGALLSLLGRQPEAVVALRALAERTGDPGAWRELGVALQEAGDVDAAVQAYLKAMALAPDASAIEEDLASAELAQGDGAAALSRMDALAARGALAAGGRFRRALALPAVYGDANELLSWRERFAEGLAALERDPPRLLDPVREVGQTPFLLAYQGEDDRLLMEALARTYRHACPELVWTAPRAESRRERRERIRIGFVSQFFFEHSVGRTMAGLIEGLPRDRFEIEIFAVPPVTVDALQSRVASAGRWAELPANLWAARERIAERGCDLLFYADLGMEPLSYFLAQARLAPVQVTSWGHPVTSGLPTVDAFVSHALLEPDGAQEQYSEKLLTVTRGALYPAYERRQAPPRPRRELGLPEAKRLYVCGQSLFKLDPRFDATLLSVLERDPDAVLLLFEARERAVTAKVRDRLARRYRAAAERVTFLRRGGIDDYMQCIRACDVVLDTWPVGGGVSTHDALAAGAPVVTLPGSALRGRFAQAALRLLGLDECIASSAEDYAERAVAIARDPELRRMLALRIDERSSALFGERIAIDAVAEALERCCQPLGIDHGQSPAP
jgi:tetratricopeptide (TPR) repeat protein